MDRIVEGEVMGSSGTARLELIYVIYLECKWLRQIYVVHVVDLQSLNDSS